MERGPRLADCDPARLGIVGNWFFTSFYYVVLCPVAWLIRSRRDVLEQQWDPRRTSYFATELEVLAAGETRFASSSVR